MSKPWKCLLLIFVMLTVTGCARQDADQSSTVGEQPMTTATRYTVVSEIDYPPLEFVDEAGAYKGFDIELMQALGKAGGFDPVFKNTSFDSIPGDLQANSADLSISALTITPDLQQLVDFSVPYMETGLVIAVRKDNNAVGDLEDLKGKPLAARTASNGADQCREISSSVKLFDTVPEALAAVRRGDAVAVIDSMPITAYYVNQSPDDFKLAGSIINEKHYGIAVAKNRPELLQKINDGLNKLKADGEYAALYKKWFGRDPEPYLPGEPPK